VVREQRRTPGQACRLMKSDTIGLLLYERDAGQRVRRSRDANNTKARHWRVMAN